MAGLRPPAYDGLRAAFEVIERLHAGGDDYVRGLDDFWSGRAPTVVAAEDAR